MDRGGSYLTENLLNTVSAWDPERIQKDLSCLGYVLVPFSASRLHCTMVPFPHLHKYIECLGSVQTPAAGSYREL